MDEPISSRAYDYAPRTPSPKRKTGGSPSPFSAAKDTFSDRLIPSRASAHFACGFDLWEVNENAKPANTNSSGSASRFRAPPEGMAGVENHQTESFDNLLRSELLGTPPKLKGDIDCLGSPETKNFFQYKSSFEEVPLWCGDVESSRTPIPLRITEHPCQAKTPQRKIPKFPMRVLDAPDMQDDFYLNLLDWSSADDLAVGLGSNVYSWNASSCRVTKFCDLSCDFVTSVCWTKLGGHLAVGSSSGQVQIWDKETTRKLRTMEGHRGHVCAQSFGAGPILSTGGRDGTIFHRDVRDKAHSFAKVEAHSSQVCGLKWSPDEQQLASGSDDCKVKVWSLHKDVPVVECSRNQAAVKALAWSPHQAGVLASGGGVADKCIRIWNTSSDSLMKCVDTGSQVCNLAWSKNVNEIVSAHGYSLNEVAVWKCPSMTRIAKLTGHTRRVLYMGVSADGRKIATGSGDATVRIWDIFPAGVAICKSSMESMLPRTIR